MINDSLKAFLVKVLYNSLLDLNSSDVRSKIISLIWLCFKDEGELSLQSVLTHLGFTYDDLKYLMKETYGLDLDEERRKLLSFKSKKELYEHYKHLKLSKRVRVPFASYGF